MTGYLNVNGTSIENLVRELYDFNKVGALAIPGFITGQAREELLSHIRSARYFFSKAPMTEGTVTQDVERLFLDEGDEENLSGSFKSRIKGFKEEYLEFYDRMGKLAKFRKRFNSIGMNYYPKDSIGISIHQDYSIDVNLVSVFVLSGKAPFYVCKRKSKEEAIQLESSPGTLILMRGPRNEQEQMFRPFHYVGDVEEERYSMIIRTMRRK